MCGTERTAQEKDCEFILTVKMETRHPVEGQFDSEFPAIGNHCGVMTAWSRKIWKFCEKILRFLEKRPITVKFLKFCSESFHRCIVVFKCRKIYPKGNGQIVRYLANKTNSAVSQTVATVHIAPNICQDQPATICAQCSSFHPNPFTFGPVE